MERVEAYDAIPKGMPLRIDLPDGPIYFASPIDLKTDDEVSLMLDGAVRRVRRKGVEIFSNEQSQPFALGIALIIGELGPTEQMAIGLYMIELDRLAQSRNTL